MPAVWSPQIPSSSKGCWIRSGSNAVRRSRTESRDGVRGRALPGWAVPYVVPVASAFRVFDSEGRVKDEGVELQLRTLGAEVVRVATRFANHVTPRRARECEESAERVAGATVSTAAGS
jgi:hypothetical protein